MNRAFKIVAVILLIIAVGLLGFIMFKSGMITFKIFKQSETKEYTYSLGEYMVNLNEPNRYIKVKISVGYKLKNLDKELSEKTSSINDSINTVLRSKKLEDVSAAKTESLKKELLDKINSLLTKGKLTNIYFEQILVQ